MGEGTSWYRVVGTNRRTREAMLRSRAGRFHRDGDLEPTSYVADSIETAWREVTAYLGAARPDIRAFKAIRVTTPEPVYGAMVDLRTRVERRRQRVTKAELEARPAPESLTMLARRLRAEGKAGVAYASVRNQPSGVCLALFLEHTEHNLEVEPAADEWERFVEEWERSESIVAREVG